MRLQRIQWVILMRDGSMLGAFNDGQRFYLSEGSRAGCIRLLELFEVPQ